MFKLIKLNSYQYGVLENDVLAVGTRAQALGYLHEVLGVAEQVISEVTGEFEALNKNVADFGVNRNWTFIAKQDVREYLPSSQASAPAMVSSLSFFL